MVLSSLTVLLAACGVSTGAAGPEAVSAGLGRAPTALQLARAAQATADVTARKVWVEVATTSPAGTSFTVTAEGAFDTATRRGQLVTEVSGDLALLEELGTTEVIYDGDVAYLKAPFLELLTGGKPWVRVDDVEIEGASDELDAAGATGAGDLLELLERVGEVEELGAEAVRGVATRHLGVQIDIGRAVDEADADRAAALRERLGKLGVDVDALTAIPAEVWVDDDGYVRRFSLTLDVATLASDLGEDLPEGAAGTTVTQTVELYDFGVPVEVDAPPADQVAELDLADLFGD